MAAARDEGIYSWNSRTIMVGAIGLRLIFIITVENYEAQP